MRRSSRDFGSFSALRFTPQKSEILMMFLLGTPACRLVSLFRQSVWFRWLMNYTHEIKFSRL